MLRKYIFESIWSIILGELKWIILGWLEVLKNFIQFWRAVLGEITKWNRIFLQFIFAIFLILCDETNFSEFLPICPLTFLQKREIPLITSKTKLSNRSKVTGKKIKLQYLVRSRSSPCILLCNRTLSLLFLLSYLRLTYPLYPTYG